MIKVLKCKCLVKVAIANQILSYVSGGTDRFWASKVRKIKQERRIYRGCRKLQKGSTENFRSKLLPSQFCLGVKPTATVFRSVLSMTYLQVTGDPSGLN